MALVVSVSFASAATLATWDFNATSTTSSATSSNVNLVASSVSVGAGISPGTFTYSDNGITANGGLTDGWNEVSLTAAVTDNDYYQVTITPNTGFNFVINSVSFNHLTNDATGMDFTVRSSEDNFASNLSTGTSTTTSATATISSLKLGVAAGETFTLRIYGYNTAAVTDTFTLDNLVLSGNVVPTEVITSLTTGDSHDQLTIDSLDLSVENGYGEDESWYPLDTVNIETNVEYNGADSDLEMQNIEVKWGLFDRTTGRWIIDDEEKDFDLKGGKDQDVNLQFKLDEKLDKLAGGDLIAYVIATGEDEEYADIKTSDYAEAPVTIQTEDALILDNIQYPESVQCGEDVIITADIWNLGDKKLENNYILVNSQDLGITDERVDIGDFSDFDDTKLNFALKVPTDVEEKTYYIKFTIYDEDDSVFEIADDESAFKVLLSVEGSCIIDPKLTISAELDSEVLVGEELVVIATVTNTDTKSRTFSVAAGDYESWAELVEISPASLTLAAGESKEVKFTFKADEDSAGEQEFNIVLTDSNEKIITQPASVLVEKSQFSLTGLVSEGNGYLWAIGALNVVLVIAIIVAVVKIARRK